MFTKLDGVVSRFEEIQMRLQHPEVTNDQKLYRSLMKEYSNLSEVVSTYREYKKAKTDLAGNKEILLNEKDEMLREMAKEEIGPLEENVTHLEEKLKILLLPKDPNDDKNIILEIRPAAGGDEAALFAEELFRAYVHFASSQGWQVETLSYIEGNVGGVKEANALISGDKVYSKLKYESGVHRVQRVPKTEAMGRVHTSTVTVAVLPEAEEVDVHVNSNDIRVDVFRSGGAGGQSVNTTDSAVRLTYLPTGMIVICQDEKSQLKNKNKAMKVLLARLLQIEQDKQMKENSTQRLSQIGTGDRSERIRTYNFPQSRITDHRIGHTVHQLTDFMSGKVELMIEPLVTHYQAEALKQQKTT